MSEWMLWMLGCQFIRQGTLSLAKRGRQACRMQREKQRFQPLRALLIPSGAKAQRL